MNRRSFIVTTASAAATLASRNLHAQESSAIKKVKDIVIYNDDRFYSAFPSLVTKRDGEVICAFRRAPERRVFGEGGSSHTDPNSYLVLVRSRDAAESWTKNPELILAHPYGGSQDPCLLQLRDGGLLCSSYGWARLESSAAAKFDASLRHGDFVFMGGYLMRSDNGGLSWEGPILPPPLEVSVTKNVFGEPCPAYNRGAMIEGSDGRIYWAVASQSRIRPRLTEVHLLTSSDRGSTWQYSCPVAVDEKVTFNETSLYETPKGDIVAFMRTADFDDHTCVARSNDGGKSFEKWIDVGWQGHPHFALRLRDDRVLLIYGYRHTPFGIRARVLDAECQNVREAPEIILRDDGGNGDIGYPWATTLPNGNVLVAYYFNKENGTRHIAGTILNYA
jgi:sialidase-1